jgi:nucleotide-binding universal stress UspA family protein
VLHVLPHQHAVYGMEAAVVAEAYQAMPAARAAANSLLEDCAERLQTRGVSPTVEQQLTAGDPADEILSYAAATAADLIVLGSGGLNAVQRFWWGPCR